MKKITIVIIAVFMVFVLWMMTYIIRGMFQDDCTVQGEEICD